MIQNGTYNGLGRGVNNGLYNGTGIGATEGTTSGQKLLYPTPLLDIVPNSAAAYSLRKLRTNYIGPCIRVRRSSDNAELDIGFIINNLDTLALLSFVGSNDGFVRTWYDQSGNGRNASQTTLDAQPRIVVAGTIVTRNNNLAVLFDGSNDVLFNNTTGFEVNNVSQYAVSSRGNSANALRTIFSTGILGAGGIGFGFVYAASPDQDGLFQQIRNLNTSTPSIGNYTNILDQNNLIFGIGTSSIDYTYFNGGDEKSISHTRANVTSNQPISLGARYETTPGFYLNGTITEVVFWSSNQFSMRIKIQNNVNSYYKIY